MIKDLRETALNVRSQRGFQKYIEKYNSEEFYTAVVNACIEAAKDGQLNYHYGTIRKLDFNNKPYILSDAYTYMTNNTKKKLKDDYGITLVRRDINNYAFIW